LRDIAPENLTFGNCLRLGEKKMEREKEKTEPEFDINDRGFNVKAWYLKDTETSKGDALIEVSYNNKIIRKFLFPAYKIYNIAAHFSDIVDGELSKDEKTRGYAIAASSGLGGFAPIQPID
jgi:hypothetical protein